MSLHHDHAFDDAPNEGPAPAGYARVLWVALLVNALMFAVEVGAGVRAGSVSLLADAIDFFGDGANYALSLAVLSLHLAWRARAALLKAGSMALFGAGVLARALWSAWHGVVPEPATMGLVGLLAFAANVGVAVLLYRYRGGDANMRSVWLCTRNDALGNLAVIAAAAGVFGTGTSWPDLLVATAMALLALTAAWSVTRHALGELRAGRR
ncbi:cation transporter [Ramlibacter sp.]|uniref:cation transporter n=1 Tax=Ramlibacter sp. TaxID=1917967 RepID=UPI002D445AE9|nr:cation transporter [Ramlibacter sp.]HYD77910.1 cation transporter [Ramlibacter sp.]